MELQKDTSKQSRKNFSTSQDEKEIRQLYEDFEHAMSALDVEKVMAFYSPDVIAYDLMPPLQYSGKESYRKAWELGFSSTKDMTWNFSGLKVFAGNDVAFCHALVHCFGKDSEGRNIDMWCRWTDGLRKENGQWLIVHEQCSVPISMENEKGLFNLKPEDKSTH